jgi:hypothetical protein
MSNRSAFRVILVATSIVLSMSTSAFAFHSGGTGECQGCHSMHDLSSGNAGGGQRNPGLLKGADASSTCLACHASPSGTSQPAGHYVSTSESDMPPGVAPSQLTPGGDFGWLKKRYLWGKGTGRQGESPGERHGHNIVAATFNYAADMKNATAPQGTYPSDQLSCVSCHDPHGRYRRLADRSISTTGLGVFASGSYEKSPDPNAMGAVGVYRMLGGKGYRPGYLSGGASFLSNPPAAVAPLHYNRDESLADTRVAYGSGMSEWCQNCHPMSHQEGSAGGSHAAGNTKKLSPDMVRYYNSYVASGNTNGSPATAYTSIVPFEMGTDDYALLKQAANSDGSDRTGPDSAKGTPNVMCLSCHRAHASAWDNMTRWNMKSEFLVHAGSYPATDNGAPEEYAQGRMTPEVQRAYYGRPATLYASYQRSLCNKCHMKD